MFRTVTHSLSDLERAARFLCDAGNRHFALYGDLGAGKTALVGAFCRVLGVEQRPASPTFALVHQYLYPAGNVYHLDLYRLQHAEEVLDLGLPDMLEEKNAYVFIEWPQIAELFLPEQMFKLRITVQEDDSRLLEQF